MSLLQICGGRVAEFIGSFEKASVEGIAAPELLFSSSFAVHGNCNAQIRCKPIFCTRVLNPYTLRRLTGLHGDHMDEILLYMAREEAKIAGLHAKARLLKSHRLWEMLYLHPDNTLIHPSRRMLLSRGAGGWWSGRLAVNPPPPPPRDAWRTIVWLLMLLTISCLESERPRQATVRIRACQVPQSIEIGTRKVDLEQLCV